MNTTAYKRPLIISAVLAALIVAAGVWANALLYAPLCLLAALWQIVRGLYYLLRRKWPALKLCGLRLLIWIAAMFLLTAVHSYYKDITQQRGEALVTALQSYRVREGRYPRELAALAPRDIAGIPLTVQSPGEGRPFRYRLEGETGANYQLMFHTGFRWQHTYDPKVGKWVMTD